MSTKDEKELSAFERLAKINVNEHVEKKNNLNYLSWAWAIDQLLRQDPEAKWEYGEPKLYGETMMVFCTVTAFGKQRTAFLPVMDHRNKPIPNPDAFQVNTAMQRCLVKAIALHGLGLYIYAGEDLPEGEETVAAKVIAANVKPTAGARDGLTPERRKAVQDTASRMLDWLNAGSVADAVAEKENAALDADETVYLWTFFDSKQKNAMKAEYLRQRQAEAA